MDIRLLLSIVLAVINLDQVTCQERGFNSTTDWWSFYKNKSSDVYTSVKSINVHPWDSHRQEMKERALSQLGTIGMIDVSCQPAIDNYENQMPAIACVVNQEQRLCEFGWQFLPLSTKQETCYFENSVSDRGNCCTIVVEKS